MAEEEVVKEEVVVGQTVEPVKEKTDEELFYPDKEEDKSPDDKAPVEEDKKDEESKEKEGLPIEDKKPEEEKVEEEKPKEEEKKSDDDDKQLEFTVKDLEVPENSMVTEDDLQRIAEIVKKQGLSKDVAQLIVDEKIDALDAMADKQKDDLEETISSWRKETENDKDIGGDKLNETVRLCNLVLDKHGSPKLRSQLSEGGFGNYIELVKLLSSIGSTMSNDEVIRGGTGATVDNKSLEEYFYPNTN